MSHQKTKTGLFHNFLSISKNLFRKQLDAWKTRFVLRAQKNACNRLSTHLDNVHVFLVPGEDFVTGGVISFHRLARLIESMSDNTITTVLVSVADSPTHFQNSWFKSEKRVLSPTIFANHVQTVDEMTIHIPPVYLKAAEKTPLLQADFLGKVTRYRTNILNQNPWNMPAAETFNWLRSLGELSQTVGFERVCTQDYAMKYQTPVHFFPNRSFMDEYQFLPFDTKQPRLFISPDRARWRDMLLDVAATLEIGTEVFGKGHYDKYLKSLSQCRYIVTLGEGFDGYFVEGFFTGSVVFAVYNADFFPDDSYRELVTVFDSPEALCVGIEAVIDTFEKDPAAYADYVNLVAHKIAALYSRDEQRKSLEQFEDRKYHQNV